MRKRDSIVKTPTCLQMEAVECGAASLKMILAYYGKNVPLEELRIACGVSRDGSKATNIVKAARAYNLEAKGYSIKSLEKLDEQPLPAIIFWNFFHFVVLEGRTRNGWRINDPAVGRRVVPEDEFNTSYTGVVLTFSPGPAFEPGGRDPGLIQSLRPALAGSSEPFKLVLLASLALVIPGIVIPIFSKVFVDEVVVAGLHNWVPIFLAVMAFTITINTVLTAVQQLVLAKLETKLAIIMSARFVAHALRLPVEFYAQRFAGDINQRIGENDRFAKLLSGDLATNAFNLFSVVFFAAIMATYDLILTGIAILFALLNFGGLMLANRWRVEAATRSAQESGKLAGIGMSGLQIIETLKATGSENDFFLRWASAKAKALNAETELDEPSKLLEGLPDLLSSLSIAAVLAIGGYQIIEGNLTLGGLVAFQALLASFNAPVAKLTGLGSQLQEARAGLERINDVLRYPHDPRTPTILNSDATQIIKAEPASIERLQGHVCFKGVSFGYNRLEPPLIKDLSFEVRPGERIALVGGSGSGKSTVAKLLLGIFKPWSGQILIDGIPIEEIDPDLLHRSLASVDQDILMFEGTIRENLTFWDPSVPTQTLIRAAEDACIADDLLGRRNGFDAPISEGGANFSGGQRQRIEIARALAGNPSILVLDEATAALDPVTELEIDGNIRSRGSSCLVVAHRLSTIRDSSEIIVLERGNVVQRGTHENLLEDSEAVYAHLVKEA